MLAPFPRPSQFPLCLSLLVALLPIAATAASLRPATIKPFSFAQKVAVYGDVDKRQTVPDYARSHGLNLSELKKTIDATGEIICGGKWGTASLVDSDLIVTAFHVIKGVYDCAKPTEAPHCSFKIASMTQRVAIRRVVGTGEVCASPQSPRLWDNDWAVLKLEEPILTVVPYRLPVEGVLVTHSAGTKVVFIGVHSGDWFTENHKTGARTYPEHVEDCTIRQAYSWGPNSIYFSSDCDLGEMSSGGSVLSGLTGTPTLVGIAVGNEEGEPILGRALDTGIPNKRPYDEQTWASRNIPLDGEFLMTVRAARP